jgi:hypothetical protein
MWTKKVNMELIIDFDAINDSSKRDWLIRTLKLMGIDYKTKGNTQIGSPQSLEEYNQDIKAGNEEIDAGQFKSATDLKKDMDKW